MNISLLFTKDGCENVFGRLALLANNGNCRSFGALQFRRLLKRYILGQGEKIPLQPNSSVKEADTEGTVYILGQ